MNTKHEDVDNGQDILDIRDLIERFEELESAREDLEGEALAEFGDGDGIELKHLQAFLDEMRGNGGDHQWRGNWYPVTLIRESYWRDYVQEYADDIHGAAMRDAQWPMNCIDWDKAGDELQMDYTGADFDGITYYFR